ncbi:MAG: integrase/recombinase XerD [Patescibacteria group bacterium]|nr:integrase/recombinase XerD [Patescibacteria group bacterium]
MLFRARLLGEVDEEVIKLLILECKRKGLSSQTQNVYISAIKFYLYEIEKMNRKLDIRRPKKGHFLPTVLSHAEVMKILELTQNLKHRTLLALTYSAGLRVSEVVSLRIRDISFEEGVISVRGG